MIRILVVEDEPPILRGLCAMIEQTDIEFKVTGRASNGKRALELLESNKFDAVFTDIKMPVMDGIALSEEIRNKYGNISIVITSGYSDFSYAKQAIKFSVTAYMLKPISKEELKQVLETVRTDIKNHRHISSEKSIINDSSISKTSENCIVIQICAGPYSTDSSSLTSDSVWEQNDLGTMVEGLIFRSENCMTFPGRTDAQRTVIIEPSDPMRAEAITKSLVTALCKKTSTTITAAFMPEISMPDIGKTIKKLENLMLHRTSLTKSQIINPACEYEASKDRQYSVDIIRSISSYLLQGNTEKAQEIIYETFEKMESANSTQEELTEFLNLLISDIYTKSNNRIKNISEIRYNISSVITEFADYKTLAQEVASVFIQPGETDETSRHQKLISDVTSFLNENYKNPVTNTEIGNRFGFVPSYISRLFREYKGISPKEYLIKLRIDKAKEIMSDNPQLLVKEIAPMVGFSDAYYFSKTFKKETGHWPTSHLK